MQANIVNRHAKYRDIYRSLNQDYSYCNNTNDNYLLLKILIVKLMERRENNERTDADLIIPQLKKNQ